MRNDPASAAVVIMLRSIKMYGMAQAVTDLIEQGAPAFEAAIPILSQLLKAELAEREVRSIAYHMKAARFPAYKDLSGFEFAASEVNEATVRTLHRCEFIDGAQNVVLIGGPGTGKTHVATALGIQAIEHHRRKVRFLSTIELVNTLEQEKAKGKAGQIAEAMTKFDLVILDELGYLPFSASGVPERLLDLMAQGRLVLGFAGPAKEEIGVRLRQEEAAPLRDVALDAGAVGLWQQEVEGLAVLHLARRDHEPQPFIHPY